MENHRIEQKKVQEVIRLLNFLSPDKNVKVKIRYLLDILEVYGNELYSESNKELCSIMMNILSRIEHAMSLNKTYVDMRVEDFKSILTLTRYLGLDKSMVVITNGIDDYKAKRKK